MASRSRSRSRAVGGLRLSARDRIARLLQAAGARGLAPTTWQDAGAWYRSRDNYSAEWVYPTHLEQQVQRVRNLWDLSGATDLIAPAAGAGVTPTARVNLLQRTEDLTHSAWVKTRSSTAANAGVAPDGSSTAVRLIEDTSVTSTHDTYQDFSAIPSGSRAVASVCVKASGRSWMSLNLEGATGRGAYFDIANGVVGSSNGSIVSSRITNLGNGWRRCSVVFDSLGHTRLRIYLANGNGSPTYTGDGTSGVLLWGADLRLAIWDSFNIPEYQRVNDGTAGVFDYAHAGFPVRLEAQANGRGLRSAGTVNFTNTDALHAGAVVVKTSDAAEAVVMELGPSSATTTRSIAFLAPSGAGANNYRMRSSGTTIQSTTTAATYQAPHLAALRGRAEINPPVIGLTVNADAEAVFSGSQGTGNYGDHVLNIAGRDLSGTPSLRFAGGMFGTPFILDANAVPVDLAAEMLRDIARVAGHTY